MFFLCHSSFFYFAHTPNIVLFSYILLSHFHFQSAHLSLSHLILSYFIFTLSHFISLHLTSSSHLLSNLICSCYLTLLTLPCLVSVWISYNIQAMIISAVFLFSVESMNIGATAGIIAGILAGIVCLGIVIYCCCRKKDQKDKHAEGYVCAVCFFHCLLCSWSFEQCVQLSTLLFFLFLCFCVPFSWLVLLYFFI